MRFEGAPQFIKKHAEEMVPLVDDAESRSILRHLESDEDVPEDIRKNPDKMSPILRAYESKLYSFDKGSLGTAMEGKRVFVTMNDPLSYATLAPLMRGLLKDSRASGVTALASGYASKHLEADFADTQIEEVRDPERMIIEDVMEHAGRTHPEIIIGTASSINGPESLALFAGKSALEARKLYFYFEGWGTAGSSFSSMPSEKDKVERAQRMDSIDRYLVVDEVAKKILMHEIPSLSEDKISVVGSPVIDAIAVPDAAAFTAAARAKAGLDPSEIALLYAGDVSHDYSANGLGTDPEINEKTFDKTLSAVIETARNTPDKKYVVLARPHPRDPNKDRLLARLHEVALPENLRLQAADNSVVSMQEARYAADAVLSIGSTENFLAPRIERRAIFLRYADEPGLGAVVGDKTYGRELEQAIADDEPLISFVRSGEEIVSMLSTIERAIDAGSTRAKGKSSVETISDLIFSDAA